MTLGFFAFIISGKVHISSIPVLMVLGFLFGPVLGFIDKNESRELFNFIRVSGLVIILYTEGHNLKWNLIKKHIATIAILDTIGLIITALLAGLSFSYLFNVPFFAGFLFGAIISATDPATLIPLFKQNKVDKNIRTVIVTESIFNDPLGISITILAIALVVPQAPEAHFIEFISHYTTIYPAAVIFFLYEIISSIIIGLLLGIFGYWLIRVLKLNVFPQIFSLVIAFGGFLIGERLQASGYLVATMIGIVFGNHELIFKNSNHKDFSSFIKKEQDFNEVLSNLSSVFIFILIGATVKLSIFGDTLWKGGIIALTIVLVIRPIAALTILPLKKWSFKEYLFISLEGPRGVVPSALSGLPLSLGLLYNNKTLIEWGEIILTTTVITVLISVLIETLWIKPLSELLLKKTKNSKRA
jgi:potassium/hydrogen antiporter